VSHSKKCRIHSDRFPSSNGRNRVKHVEELMGWGGCMWEKGALINGRCCKSVGLYGPTEAVIGN
jgi:hypothetical protein